MAKGAKLAKLSQPRLYDALARERLFRVLDDSRACPAIWVAGPPGAGKTTLVASWLEARGIHRVWFQVDEGDIDPSTFFFYLREAAKSFGRRKRLLPLLTPEYLFDVPDFTRRFFRQFFSMCSAGTVLVLDNCQEAEKESFGPLLAEALREIPSEVTVVAVSRTQPPPALARMQANHQLAVLGWDQLRLTADESTDILKRVGLPDPDMAAELSRRADGWIAALILLAFYVKRGGLEVDYRSLGTKEALFDYFAGEIFSKVSSEQRQILMFTALLPQVTPVMAAELTGSAAASDLLDELYQGQYLVERRMVPELTYRYHDLFREFLVSRLEQTVDQPQLQALRLQAGELLARTGDAAHAVELFRQAERHEAAAMTILQHAPALLSQGRWQTLQAWIGGLPRALLSVIPWLRYWLGIARMQVDLQDARDVLSNAFTDFERTGDSLGQALSAAAIIHACYYEYNDFARMDPWVLQLDRLLVGEMQFNEPGGELFVCSALVLAGTFRQPRHPQLQARIERVGYLIDSEVEINQRVSAAIALLGYYSFALKIDEADQLIRKVAPMVKLAEVTALNQVFWWLFVGNYLEARALRYGEGRKFFDLADRIAAENGLRQTEFLSRVFRVYSHIAWGDLPETYERLLRELSELLDPHRPMDAAQYYLAKTFASLYAMEGGSAARHGRRAVAATEGLGVPYITVSWKAVAAAGLTMDGDFRNAERLLEEAEVEASGTYLECFSPLFLLGRAYAEFRDGRHERWKESMREALVSAKQRGATALAWAPGVKDLMLAEAMKAGIELDFVRTLAKKLRAKAPHEPLTGWPWPVRVYTLGEFRVELNDAVLTFPRKAPKKTLTLLKILIAFGGRNVPQQKLVDILWPDEEGDAGHEAFAISLHRLRKILVHQDAIQLSDGALSLHVGKCWVDVWALEHAFSALERSDEIPDACDEDLIWSHYRGSFLPEDPDAPWAVSMRERLRSRFLRHVARTARRYEDGGRLDLAVELYQKGIDSDDLAEEFYQGLIRCRALQGRRAEAMAVYRRLRQILSVTLSISPSPESQRLYQSLQGE